MRAMSAVAAESPVKPNNAATSEISKNINAHLSNDIVNLLTGDPSFPGVVSAKAAFGSISANSRTGYGLRLA